MCVLCVVCSVIAHAQWRVIHAPLSRDVYIPMVIQRNIYNGLKNPVCEGTSINHAHTHVHTHNTQHTLKHTHTYTTHTCNTCAKNAHTQHFISQVLTWTHTSSHSLSLHLLCFSSPSPPPPPPPLLNMEQKPIKVFPRGSEWAAPPNQVHTGPHALHRHYVRPHSAP